MEEVYTGRGATRHQINSLAEWVRANVGLVEHGKLDVIRFVEIDLQSIFPGLYLEIRPDEEMGRAKAFLSEKAEAIVVSESIYNLACEKNLPASETILHEVGHLFLHRNYAAKGLHDARGFYKPQFEGMGAANSVEWQAKYFARCMLFPYQKMKNLSRRLEFQVYFELSVVDATRAEDHIRSLRLSETGRRQNKDRAWLENTLRSLGLGDRRSQQTEEQLCLFYRPNNSASKNVISVTN